MSWPTALLGDVATSFVDGPFGSNLKSTEYISAGVPVARIQNVRPNRFDDKGLVYISHLKAQQLERHDFREGDLLVTKLGEPAGVACVVPAGVSAGRIVADVTRFRGKHGLIDHRYLAYFLNSPEGRAEVAKRAKGSTRQRVNLSTLKEIPIPLAPIGEQQRIAALLDQADELRRKRRVSLKTIEALRESLFRSTFVDAEAHDWPSVEVGSLSEDIRTGPFGSQLLHSEFVDSGIAVLGIDNAVQNEFTWSERRYITEHKYRSLARYTVRPGDLIITIMGTCGRCAIVPDNIPVAINTKHLCCITLDRRRVTPSFLHAAFLMHPDIRKQLGVHAKGAVMPGLNMGIVKSLKLRLPPLELQEAFGRQLRQLASLRGSQREHLAQLDALFAALQHRAFRGELTAKAVQRELAEAG